MSESRYSVPNLERALKIIEYLSRHASGFGISEIAEKLDYPKNSVFRIMKTLNNNGYLVETGKQYQLSTKFLSVAYNALSKGNLTGKAAQSMIALRNECHETVLLGALNGTKVVVLDTVLSEEPLKFVVDAGHHIPVHSSAAGKVLLAYLPEDERENILEKMEFVPFNDNTVKCREEFLKEMVPAVEKGYALDKGENTEGLNSFAAPIFNYQKRPIGVIWITGPTFRLPQERFDEYGLMVRKYANKISTLFGYDSNIQD